MAFLGRHRDWVRTFSMLVNAIAHTFCSGEYPAGSVGCAEASGEMKYGHRNRWFIWFTNVQIDFGFVMGSFLPM